MITAALRNSNNQCINSTASITFSVSGPATPLGPTTLAAAGGKIALLLRSSTTAGTITVNANSSGLPQASATITSVPPFSGNVIVTRPAAPPSGRAINAQNAMRNRLVVFDINGRVRKADPRSRSNGLRPGVYIVTDENSSGIVARKIARAAQ
jgi:hypothetical protein